jgi:hypothetical protein
MTKFIEEKPATLLSVGHDVKTVKGQKRGYLTGILYLFPYKAFGFNICPNAERADCHEPCLNTAGRGRFNKTQAARLRKTWLFHNERDWFMNRLFRDIEALQRKAQREGLTPVVRLNGTSDIDWESIRYEGMSPMEFFYMLQFYDYVKMPRVAKNSNYHLTFSFSSAQRYQVTVKKAMRLKMNMAIVSEDDMPKLWMGRKVVNGDKDDLRFLDPDGCIVWLSAKGYAIGSDSDLIVRVA